MRLPREQRQELVGYLSGEGMSTRAIAPIVGTVEGTVRNDLKAGAQSYAPASVEATAASVLDARPVTGLDGTTYTVPTPQAPRRRAITDQARDSGWVGCRGLGLL